MIRKDFRAPPSLPHLLSSMGSGGKSQLCFIKISVGFVKVFQGGSWKGKEKMSGLLKKCFNKKIQVLYFGFQIKTPKAVKSKRKKYGGERMEGRRQLTFIFVQSQNLV